MPGIVQATSSGTSGMMDFVPIDLAASWTRSASATLGVDGALRIVEDKDDTGKIHAKLYFTYIKSKFSLIQQIRVNRRIKLLEKAFDEALAAGQDLLAQKTLNRVALISREAMMVAKGIKYSILASDVKKFKNRIKGGHISDTKLKDFTRIIPKDVQTKFAAVKDLFDDFVIYHYWNQKAEENAKKTMTPDERSAMRDPVLFGMVKEDPTRLYFIADWEDEFCDLTFDEMLEAMGRITDDALIDNNPQIIE